MNRIEKNNMAIVFLKTAGRIGEKGRIFWGFSQMWVVSGFGKLNH
jgi:hypothetical protein